MDIAAKIDDFGKPAWIAVMVLSFILFWPIGLAVLLYLIWSGRLGGGSSAYPSGAQARRNGCGWHRSLRHPASSGNQAFDEYRAEALRRLEEEQREFTEFLERLRKARDKAEFDQFMDERSNRTRGGPIAEPEPKPAG